MANNGIFATVPIDRVKRSRFDMSHEVKTTTQMGKLTPILCKEVVPGDRVRLSTQGFIRTAPLVSPVYHRIDSFIHHFFAPTRILVEGHGEDNIWQKFITGGKDGTDTTVLPYFTIANLFNSASMYDTQAQYEQVVGPSSIWAYMGLPPLTEIGYPLTSDIEGQVAGGTTPISLLPFAALARIAVDYFLDENYIPDELIDSQPPLHEGQYLAATPADKAFILNWVMGWKDGATFEYGTYRRAYEKDYFTSALPWTQRGGDVLIPMDSTEITYHDQSMLKKTDGTNVGATTAIGDYSGAGNGLETMDNGTPVRIENIESISNSTITINDLRTAIVVQKWLETNARAGFKYNEQIFARFNVTVPDFRLDRAEYLGGGKSPIQIGEVLATATSEDGSDTLPQGNMAGRGISYQESNSFNYTCQEHGFIITIYSAIPRTGYFQGLDRMWTRTDKFDFLQPEFASLGEQEIQSDELFWDIFAPSNHIFGYTQRYAEYKYAMDRVCGDFVSTLAHWTLVRTFDDGMINGENSNDFIQVDPAEQTRIFAVQTGDNLWCHFRHDLSIIRPLPYYSVPGVSKI